MMATKRVKKLWYVLAVEPGQDKKIRREIVRQSRIRDLTKDIGRIVVKHHLEERQRNGKWVWMRVKSYPGYILINMRFTNETFHVINSLKRMGVFGFLNLPPQLGGKRYPRKEPMQNTPPKKWEIEMREDWKPTPVSSVEAGFLLLDETQVNKDKKARKKMKVEEEPAEPEYKEGDEVVVKEGTFLGCHGRVKKVVPSQDGATLTLEVTIMGRTTKIGVGSQDVERKV